MRDRLAVRLQALREKTQREAAYVIQKTMRAYVARKGYLRKRRAIIRLQAGLRGWKARWAFATIRKTLALILPNFMYLALDQPLNPCAIDLEPKEKECCALREQLFRNLSNQTKRNRRLNAYHETLLSDVPEQLKFQRCPAALLGCLDVEKSANKEIERSLHDVKSKAAEMKTTTEYLPMSLKSRISAIPPMPIEKFAAEIFRGHLLEPRREPILTPFLHKENDIDFRLSIEIFKLILKYMNDQTLNRQQLNDLARYIVKQGILNPCQRDEIFVQICNQLYKNPDKEASSRCFRLLLQAVGVFAPTETVLPMLISFASLQRQPLRNQLLSTIAWRMNIIENQHAVRLLPASRLEMGAIYGFHNPAVELLRKETPTWWKRIRGLRMKIWRTGGIGNPSGWTIEVETEKILYCPTGAHFLHDILSEIELGKEENKRSFFHNYPTERTLPPVNKTKAIPPADVPQSRILSPVVKRRTRQVNDTQDLTHRERSEDASTVACREATAVANARTTAFE
ncbi:myTH4 domain protein [Oesophagostomum dentatum]|uniref:MyTH4 domain protein n=1 Tax=Oesophagostomum dentatum TaxID=61180 RepID=A0A0B1TI81_OESDE|nr:myTH4 domain protein [Oesophagostomum dentatum]